MLERKSKIINDKLFNNCIIGNGGNGNGINMEGLVTGSNGVSLSFMFTLIMNILRIYIMYVFVILVHSFHNVPRNSLHIESNQ